MEHRYHALTDDLNAEADALWDQLNDQESREVQQHQSRFQVPDETSSRTNHWVVLQSMMWSTLERTGSAASSAWDAAKDTWRQHPASAAISGRRRRRQQRRTADPDFDELFGIHDLRHDDYTIPEDEGDEDGYHQDGSRRRRRPQHQSAGEDSQARRRGGSQTNEPEPRPNPGYPFVVLQQYPSRHAISRAKDHWGIVANMDVFLTHLYQYYYHRGMLPMVCKFLVELVSLLFTLWLSRVLLLHVDWHELTTCHDETTCHTNWSDYYRKEALTWNQWWLIQGYTILVLGYAGFAVWSFWQSLKHAWNCQFIMHEKLGISQRKLQGGAVDWDTVVEKLVQVQDSGDYRMALHSLDPLRIAQRIMRKENFLIAFWNQNLLDVQIGNRFYWCPSLEWCVHSCILNFMFNHKYEIRPAFLLDAHSLQWRLKLCGVLHLLLLPFLMIFVLLHFLFRNVYDFKISEQYMGSKGWSTVAQWTFREFNELPHVLERRLERSYEASEDYHKLFGTSEWMAALGKLLVFMGGAMAFVLLVLGVLNDAILLHVQLWGRNLLWYAGIAGIIYSIGKALLPTKESQPSVSRNLFADMDTALKAVSKHTHYYPEHWKGRGWDSKVHSQFGLFFDSKVKLFLWELISLILAPYLLIVQLPKCAPAICEFCLTSKASVAGAGDVCGFSTFDFDTFKDEAWEGKTLGESTMLQPNATDDDDEDVETGQAQGRETLEESFLRTGNLEEATRRHPKPRAREGKMEKSFFSFQASHPNWKCSPSGQSLINRVEEYRKAEVSAQLRERELHIEAAARQLETLARLEREHQAQHSPAIRRFHRDRVQDAHHFPTTTGKQVAEEDRGDAPLLPSLHKGPTTNGPPPKASETDHAQLNHTMTKALTRVSSASSASAFPFANGTTPATPLHYPETIMGAINGTGSHLTPGPTPVMYLPTASQGLEPTPEGTTPGSVATPLSLVTASSSASHRDALRAGLSTELRKLLTLSTSFDHPSESVLGASVANPATAAPLVGSVVQHLDAPTLAPQVTGLSSSTNLPDRTAERQYYWLERFHQHLESQQRQEERQAKPKEENDGDSPTNTTLPSSIVAASTASEPIPRTKSKDDDDKDNNEPHNGATSNMV